MLKKNNFNQLIYQSSNLFQQNLSLNNFSTSSNFSFKKEEKKINNNNNLCYSTNSENKKEEKMFCFQCEQTANGKGCTVVGVCGKKPEVAALQDVSFYQTKIASFLMNPILKDENLKLKNIELIEKTKNLILNVIYAALTNVNFDSKRFIEYSSDLSNCINELKKIGSNKNINIDEIDFFKNIKTENLDLILEKGKKIGITQRINDLQKKKKISLENAKLIVHMQELLTYGIRGFVAYYTESLLNYDFKIEKRNMEVENFLFECLSGLMDENNSSFWDVNSLVGKCLECGKANFFATEQLDISNNEKFGHPEPTKITIFPPKKGKCILVTGHNIKDLKKILEKAEKEKVNVYTHGEMLPSMGYPEIKKFKSYKGHFGGAWQKQKSEFKYFPGPIVITTNCVVPPTKDYIDKIFTTNVTGVPGCKHIDLFNENDLNELFKFAKKSEGFKRKNIKKLAENLKLELTPQEKKNGKEIIVGFGHHTVLNKFGEPLIKAIKDGYIKHFFLIGGCDGSELTRSYFTDFAVNTPKDTIILGIGCGKYRYNYLNLGEIKTPHGTFPRVLDVGQCNDSYGAVRIALGLKDAFGLKDVNELPLSLVVSWFEQKAVAVLLTLLHLGVKNIRLGPKLPAFIPQEILNVLVEKFNLIPVGEGSDAKKDIKEILKQ